MIKRINKKILLSIIIVLLLIGYYIYYKKSNTYKEIKISSEITELVQLDEVQKENEELNSESKETVIKNQEEESKKTIIVHITGAVKNVGVIDLEEGTRVIDAVNKAGGFTDEADSEKVNLAYVLTDGVKIYIPSKNETQERSATREYITADSGDNAIMEGSEMKKTNNSIVNINNATQAELETLPGIGAAIALKIISYREENGNFSNIEEIKNVSGIGENKFEKIKGLICI